MTPDLSDVMPEAERIASRFHETYERLAVVNGYKTRKGSRVPWADVPPVNKRLMIATVDELLRRGVIRSDITAPPPIVEVGPHSHETLYRTRPDITAHRADACPRCGTLYADADGGCWACNDSPSDPT